MSTAASTVRPVLVAGEWRDADHQQTFQATDPNTNTKLDAEFPVSSWADCDAALDAAVEGIRFTQHCAREGSLKETPRWPMIVLRTPKGWN